MSKHALSPRDLILARARIDGQIRTTPVLTAAAVDEVAGARLFFKCEQLQLTGSFKLRGASNALALLPPGGPGVATHSSGNHGAALACAATRLGLPAHIAVPENAPAFKLENMRRHGGQVHPCPATQQGREQKLAELLQQGLVAIPPYDDERIIAGQASVALELFDQLADLDDLVVPVGGGGLISGCALAAAFTAGGPRVIGVEPLGANDTQRSIAAGIRVENHQPETLADGLRALVGQLNFSIIQKHVHDLLSVDEEGIIAAMLMIWRELKQLVEPSAAVGLAGVLAHRERFAGRRVGIVLTGGNVDPLSLLPLLT